MSGELQITIYKGTISVALPGGEKYEFATTALPDSFIEWQFTSRLKMFGEIGNHGASSVRRLPAHLPILGTSGPGTFPINLASRGIGLLPKEEILEKTYEGFEKAKNEAAGRSWEESLPQRIEVARGFYADSTNFDQARLGGLEIFEGRTARNLELNPLASLLYTGDAPKYLSFQINCVVVRVREGDPHYRFLLSARELFAWDAFHLKQNRYPFGHLFHVVEVIDKTPFSRM